MVEQRVESHGLAEARTRSRGSTGKLKPRIFRCQIQDILTRLLHYPADVSSTSNEKFPVRLIKFGTAVHFETIQFAILFTYIN